MIFLWLHGTPLHSLLGLKLCVRIIASSVGRCELLEKEKGF